ncbi:hypothetical protein NIES4074_48290 [Cylindrospermum sp. NIES-4074]|nr:hypothetical protein NIES4074_48290 [Cylindrospermum sp. NIES-4074]
MKLLVNLYVKLFARQFFYKFNKALFKLGLKGMGVLNHRDVILSGEKHLIAKILKKKIKNEQPVIFDIGANIGNYTSLLLDSFPKAQIHAFEPHPKNYSRLTERMFTNNVKSHNIALGEECGTLTLYDKADANGSTHASIYKEVISEIYKQEVVTVDVSIDTLDKVAEREGIRYIDFLKIDTEGNELAILKGASRLLEESRIGYIHFEFNEMNIFSKVFFRDFVKLLHNYNFFRLLPSGLLPLGDTPLETELFAYQNILAVPKDK